jgi:hypothetical protein
MSAGLADFRHVPLVSARVLAAWDQQERPDGIVYDVEARGVRSVIEHTCRFSVRLSLAGAQDKIAQS